MQISYLMPIARRAMAEGGELISPGRIRWNAAGRCEKPHTRDLVDHFRVHREKATAWDLTLTAPWLPKGTEYMGTEVLIGRQLWIEMAVPCRRCWYCLRVRGALWRSRALYELQCSPRTWFCTFTLSPEAHMRAWYKAVMADPRVETKGKHDQFVARHNVIGRDITKYIKRVRKQSGANLRYLFVAEAHKSGLPHYHALIHEQLHSQQCRHSVLRENWVLGFCHIKLVTDPKQAAYVCKYLTKEAAARVRASQHYGDPPQGQGTVNIDLHPLYTSGVELNNTKEHANALSEWSVPVGLRPERK